MVSDATGAVVANAAVTITNTGTNISSDCADRRKRRVLLHWIAAIHCSVKVEAAGFRIAERTDVVLAVDQEASLNFKMHPRQISTKQSRLRPGAIVGYRERNPRHRHH